MAPWFLSPFFFILVYHGVPTQKYDHKSFMMLIFLLFFFSWINPKEEYSCWLFCNIHYCELCPKVDTFCLLHLFWAFQTMLFPLQCFLSGSTMSPIRILPIFVILTCINVSYISLLLFKSLEGRSCPYNFFYSNLNIIELGIYWQSLRETIQILL